MEEFSNQVNTTATTGFSSSGGTVRKQSAIKIGIVATGNQNKDTKNIIGNLPDLSKKKILKPG